jgi:hypothetical protein
MRNILAFTMALMIVAVLIMPTMGYTIQTPGNHSYSIKSSPRINYTISSGIAAHNLTPAMVAAAAGGISIPPAVTITRMLHKPAVTITKVPPSIHVVTKRTQYTIPAATEQVGQPAAVEKIGAVVEQPPAEAIPANVTTPTVAVPANVTAAEVAAKVTAPGNATFPENVNITAPRNATFPENVNITAPGNATFPENVNITAPGNATFPENVVTPGK